MKDKISLLGKNQILTIYSLGKIHQIGTDVKSKGKQQDGKR